MASEFVVLSPSQGSAIDEGTVNLMESFFPPRHLDIRKTIPEGSAQGPNSSQAVVSITLPRKQFRQAIHAQENLRRTLRNLPLEVQELRVGRRVKFSDAFPIKVYVADAKSLPTEKMTKRSNASGLNLHALQNSLEEWAQVRIPLALLVLVMAGVGYVGYRLYRELSNTLEDYSSALEAAASSPEGLDRVLAAKGSTKINSLVEDQHNPEETTKIESNDRGTDETASKSK